VSIDRLPRPSLRSRVAWVPGNRLELLENGEAFYPAVIEAIAAAGSEVLVETFILFDDKVGRALQAALIEAARRGAEVHVLVDGWGSPDLPASFTEPLAQAGVRLRAYEPVQRLFGARINLLRRMHRKLVVVDGRVAFVGGINYSIDHLAEYGPKAKQDYAVRIEGPLVEHVHAFCRASLEHPQPLRRRWWRRLAWQPQAQPTEGRGGGALAAFVTRDNLGHRQDIERQYRIALRAARERIVIANAYFFPGWRLLRDLRRAARRGVQVDLILQGEPDMAWVQTAASLLYGHLSRAGVRVHEYRERPLHGKVAVVDGRWATVGSSNLDPTSLGLNLEANIFVRDEAFAGVLLQRLDALIADHCRLVAVEPPGRLRSAWIALRSAVVFHFLRRFPTWALRWPASKPRVAPLTADM
jgi:cardiolipin synthase